jgi:hypothetical protein
MTTSRDLARALRVLREVLGEVTVIRDYTLPAESPDRRPKEA